MGKEESKGWKGRREVYRWAGIWMGWIGDLSLEAKEKLKWKWNIAGWALNREEKKNTAGLSGDWVWEMMTGGA